MNATDRIDYTRPFAENVRGTLYARFRRDADGIPMYEIAGSEYGPARYYTIDVHLLSPHATDIDEVIYSIGDGKESSVVLGGTTDQANDFRVTIESPGDAMLRVQVRIGDKIYDQRAWLSQMLENGYDGNPPAEVKPAIMRIKVN